MEAKLKDYYEWYEKEYAKIINLQGAIDYADKGQIVWLKKALQQFQYRFSSIWRHEILSTMKYYVAPKKTEYICTFFKLIRPKGTREFHTTYGFLYSYWDAKKKKLEHEFVCACPTFKSADGEYRHRFMRLEQLQQTRKEYLEAFEEVEMHFMKQLKKEVGVVTETLYPHAIKQLSDFSKIKKQLESDINSLRLPILLYVQNWIIDYDRLMRKALENHLADGYAEAMFSEKDDKFYTDWRKKYDAVYNILGAKLTRFRKDPKQTQSIVEIGQKYIPLTVDDVAESQNLKYGPWRELYMASQVSDLVINGITPSFPLLDDWFFIQGLTATMFDNRVTHIKMQHSEEALQIVRKLEETRRNTYIIDPIKKRELYKSANWEGLSEAINIPMDYAEQTMILAEVVLCSLAEHVGRSIGDFPTLMLSEDIRLTVGPMFSSLRTFAKYLFEFLYALYCMNSKLGLIHGDLHLNNVTLFLKRTFHLPSTKQPAVSNPHIAYLLEEQMYVFPHHARTACIIDFSRALISRQQILKDFSEAHAEELVTDQRRRITRMLERDIPDFYEQNKAQIQIALLENFDQVFHVLQAMDAYRIAGGLLHQSGEVLADKKKMDTYGDKKVLEKEIIPFVEKIRDAAHTMITNGLFQIFKKQTPDAKNPNLILLEKFFTPYQVENYTPPPEGISLVDYFSSQNTLQYNTREYDKFPPTVQFDYIKKHKIPTEEAGLRNYEAYQRYIKEKSIEDRIAEVQEEIAGAKQLRRGSPISADKPSKKEIDDFKSALATIDSELYFDT
jgi:hypothetical protein